MGNYYYLASWATGTAGAGFLGDHAEVAVAALATSSVYLLAYVRTWQRGNILSWHFYLAAPECQVIQITFAMSDSGEPILSSVRPGSLETWVGAYLESHHAHAYTYPTYVVCHSQAFFLKLLWFSLSV